MNSTNRHANGWDTSLDNFTAELTEAAYPVAIRHGVGAEWLDAELEIWRALMETVKKWTRRSGLWMRKESDAV